MNQALYKLKSGQIIGMPQTMKQLKAERRQRRLQRRANFRIGKRFAAITRKVMQA